MKDFEIKSLFIAINAAVFILVLSGFGINKNYNNSKTNQICFKYAIKKCNFKNKSKARLICNTLINHNTNISAIRNHKECRKGL